MHRIITAFVLSYFLFNAVAWAEEAETSGSVRKDLEINLDAGVSKHFGFTKYQIGGLWTGIDGIYPYWFPISELKFPIDTWMFNGNLSISIFKVLTVESNVKKSFVPKSGKMKDSDWTLPGLRTILSESDNRVKAVTSDSGILATLFSAGPFSFRLGAGFLYQNFDFSCSNVVQVDSSGPYPSVIALGGKGITYRVEYYIPYAETRPVFSFMNDKLVLTAGFKYSPYNWAKDVDDHILRGKLNKGSAKGNKTLMGLFNMKYMFDSRVYLTVGADYIYIITNKGHQKQYYYYSLYNLSSWSSLFPGYNGKLQNKYESRQISVNFGVGYSIGIL
ncbi:MAG: omptin family outer membrane protease [Spirochaetes bacterium]|jgi:outer membrane protease|nr:omptin family outer membrane protease [Spirochaetota bacterium]